jgi:hypothetical protein
MNEFYQTYVVSGSKYQVGLMEFLCGILSNFIIKQNTSL